MVKNFFADEKILSVRLGALLYIAIELGVYFTGWNHHPMKHLIAFATSSLVHLISVTFSVVTDINL